MRDAFPSPERGPRAGAPLRMFGIGSPFGDDRVGWLAADAVRAASWCAACGSDLDVRRLDRPGAALLDEMQGARRVALVDAMRGGERGRMRRLDLDDVLAGGESISSHGFGLAQTLALGRALRALPPSLALFVIEIGETVDENGPCDRLRAAVPALVEAVRRQLLERKVP